jgi:hypothetical protein
MNKIHRELGKLILSTTSTAIIILICPPPTKGKLADSDGIGIVNVDNSTDVHQAIISNMVSASGFAHLDQTGEIIFMLRG